MSKQTRKKSIGNSIRDKRESTNLLSNYINPSTEKINNKFLNESSTVVNEIIEKIISLVISTNFNNNIEKQIYSSCFDYIKDTIDAYISTAFIPHDKDETYQESFVHIKDELIPEIEPISIKNEYSNLDINNNNNSYSQSNLKLEEQIFFNNYYHGENDWDIMDEPKSNHFDRYATTMIKMKELEKEKNINLKYKKNGEVLEEVDEESEKNSVNNNKNEKTNLRINRNEDKRKTRIKEIENNNDINNTNAKKKRNLIDIMNQFSYHDLDDNDDIYVEPKDISYDKLRNEILEKQKEEHEEKKVMNKAKVELENKMRADAEKNRHLAGKKITVDANGQIVFIKAIKIDKLKKEFLSLKTGTKLVRDEEKEREKEKKKKKKKESQDENGQQNPDEKNGENEKKEVIEKGSKVENAKKIRNKMLPKLKNNKFRSSTKDKDEDPIKTRLLKRIEEGPIIPSGSNFEIMNMEVGVSLKENEKYKTGGKDFYHKYNKYSMDNYNKQLKETTEVNSFLKTYEEVANPTKSDFNYLGNLTETYNSSVGFANHSNFNTNKNYMLTNFNTLSNFGINANKSLMKTNSSLNPKLKITGGGSSLMGSMEKLNLISERQEKLAKKTENLFKKNSTNYASAKEIVLPKLEEINKFTSEILTTTNWMEKNGINNTMGTPFRNPEKPGFRQISREMGMKGKNLRNRVKNVSQEQIGTQALETVDFFKQ